MYPYLASQVTAAYGRTSGRVLELGPFSGGISYELAARHPGLEFTLADDHKEYLAHLKKEVERRNLGRRMEVVDAPLDNLPFSDASFDLVILRGAFFFIMDRPRILSRDIPRAGPRRAGLRGGWLRCRYTARQLSTASPKSRAFSTTGWGGGALLSTS